jgi:hypothetical protein
MELGRLVVVRGQVEDSEIVPGRASWVRTEAAAKAGALVVRAVA